MQSVVPRKSPNDDRNYEAITLSNKLKLLLVSDPEAIKSGCSISVGVGSLHDKERSLGLAHFLQHMLFMGSSKYPEHNEYASFITNNSGLDNAYTGDSETNFYFQIKNSAFNEAVERLSQFFNAALLKQQCIQKQSQAVHEEYVLWTNDDNCRKWQVLRKLGSGPYSRFSIGNRDTLRHEHIRSDLLEFYQAYYSANIINAVVCSSQPVQEMKSLLLPFFQAIPNKEVQQTKFDLHFSKEQTGKLVQMQSIKDQTIMQLFFVVEYLRPFYRQHVSDYITHIVGHQGEHSLLSLLKQRKLASQLSAYIHDVKTQSLVGVQIKLTEQGFENYQTVYNIAMDFMSSLQATKQVYEQIKQKKLIDFQFKQKQKISDYVCQLSSKMHYIPIEHVLDSSATFDQFDEALTNRVLGQLNPFNLLIVLSSNQQLEDPVTQKYLGAKYTVQELPERKKSGISFKPIAPNSYLPVDTKLLASPVANSDSIPQKISQNFYFLQDTSFKVCKGGIELRVFSQESEQFLELYANYLNLLLKQITYPAEALQCNIEYESEDCLIITIFGFNDTVIKVLKKMVDNIHSVLKGKQSETLFEVALNDLIQSYENSYSQQSDQVATTALDILLNERYHTIEQFLKVLNEIKFKDNLERIVKFWQNCRCKWVVVGNFEQKETLLLLQDIESALKQNKKDSPKIIQSGCLHLKRPIRHQIYLQSEQLSSSCTIVYYQVGAYTEQLYYKLLLLKNHVDEPFFNQLRTIKQMAYYLRAKIYNVRGVLGLSFILVSSTRDPSNISFEIKNFVESFFQKIEEDLSADNSAKLNVLKQSVFTKIHTPHNNLQGLFNFISNQISQNTLFFDRKKEEQIRKYLTPISAADLKQVWTQMKENTLQVYVISHAHKQSYQKQTIKAESIQDIKSGSTFWKDFFQN